MRTTEISTTASPAENAETALAQASEGSTAADLTPGFIAEHVLLRRIDTLADLPSGTIYIRQDSNRIQSVQTDKIPTSKQADLHQAIHAGRVYSLWDIRRNEFDDIDSGWWRNRTTRMQLARCRAMRSNKSRLDRSNPEED